jgi:heme A synthase
MSPVNPASRPLASYSGRQWTLPILTGAFGLSVAIWTTWFLTHLPWVGLSEQVSLPLLLAIWLVGSAVVSARVLGGKVAMGAILGVTTAAIGLLLLGTKLTELSADGGNAASVKPNAALIAGGFLLLGACVGMAGSMLGNIIPVWRPKKGYVPLETANTDQDWLGRFAIVAVAATLPLLLVGGLVTSTNSGMAVPDWPNTFGSNMFLYPLGPRARPDVFLEHSHRLFGTFVGLTIIVLLVCTYLYETRRGVLILALVLLALVLGQGLVGGLRVREGNVIHDLDSRYYRLIHGVLGQVFFAFLVVFAAQVSRPARLGNGPEVAAENPGSRRVRLFATAALHSTLLQLLFGAMYRHFREKGGGHALMSHMALSLVVVTAAALAASAAVGLRTERQDPLVTSLRRTGKALFVVVMLQFVLGWVTWAYGGKALKPDETWQALLRTSHQANGAILLGLAAWAWVLARKLPKKKRV